MSIKPKLLTLLAVFDGTTGDDHISGTEAADQISGGLGNDRLYGRGGDDVLDGGAGDDQLNGGLGTDRMVGGAGNDTYVVDNIGDRVVEASGGGIDMVKSSVTFSLGGSFIENLTLTGDARIDGTGNSLSNVLIGNRAANTLYGLGGNDVIDGGFGADTMHGGTGNDIYYVDNLMDRVIEAAGEGTDSVRSSVDFSLSDHVENLTLTGTAQTGFGNALDNTLRAESAVSVPPWVQAALFLYGLDGDDRLEGSATLATLLDGGTGADVMIGGSGNDTYYVDNIGDRVVENGNGGVDTVYSTISFNLGGGFANNITLGDLEVDTPQPDLNGLGNSLDNILIGNNGRNRLEGKAGKDELYGHGGDDTLLAGDGTDLLFGGDGNDYLDGGLGNDRMEGGAGDDWLVARGGSNIMTGGEGIDRFEIRAQASSSITDFRPGEDYILISAAVFGGGLYAGMDLEEEDFYQPHGGPATGNHGRLVFEQGVPGWASSLYLDPDGSGPERGISITGITGGAPLLEDIIIVA
ncbi:calcium-binding protein [Roseomonas sp. USHLN139]|uniref:calcium-binding protein n=1 Tax=Roseomonas sp. USHLN139 TaxID=3081298 RepID=UPI003B01D0C4